MHIDAPAIRTSEVEECARALEFFLETAPRCLDDSYYWKWLIVTFHNALQAYVVVYLTESDLTGAVRDEIAKKWRLARDTGDSSLYVEAEIYSLLTLRKRLRKRLPDHCKIDVSDESQLTQDIELLHWYRCRLLHYSPEGWTMFVSKLPTMFLRIWDVFDFILSARCRMICSLDYSEERFRRIHEDVRRFLVTAQNHYKEA